MKIGFLYAGQGAQKEQMGKALYETYETAQKLYDSIHLDIDVKDLCFHGDLATLSKTSNTQPCMVATAAVITELLKERGITPDYAAGLSLGEYSALYAAGVFDFQTALELVRFRGLAMEDAVKGLDSMMSAILGMEREPLSAICKEASSEGVVEIANYNCPGQLVIGGEKKAVEKAEAMALEQGAKRAIRLNVSGPFHTSLLKPASDKLRERFQSVPFGEMRFPVIFNSTAKPLAEGETIAELLTRQVMSSVYLEDSIRYMMANGVDTFIEIGPGKALSGFVKKISRGVTIYQVEDPETLEKTVASIKQ
ncbi:MAG: ACP S-malonyltransferase [Oscillospiraceae bacterium]|nr:ACP S-malonyltransferase [Oscillospiraceae bacterium]